MDRRALLVTLVVVLCLGAAAVTPPPATTAPRTTSAEAPVPRALPPEVPVELPPQSSPPPMARQAAPKVAPWRAHPDATRRASTECADRTARVVLTGAQDVPLGGEDGSSIGTVDLVDLRGAGWEMRPGRLVDGPADPDDPDDSGLGETEPHHWEGGMRRPVIVEVADTAGSEGPCVLGGRVWSAVADRSVTDDPATPYNDTNWQPWGWALLWHRSTGVSVLSPSAWIVGTRVERMGDGIDFQGPSVGPWRVQGVRLTEIHDDCVEADEHTSGRIDDSLLDGCYAAVASRSRGSSNGGRGTVTVSNSLVRLQPMRAAYKPLKYGSPTNGEFFKWDPERHGRSDSPSIVIENSVFRAEQGSRGGDLDLPPGVSCSGATLVWTGQLPPDQLSERVQRCFDDDGVAPLGERIVTDVEYWDDAVATWRSAHPREL